MILKVILNRVRQTRPQTLQGAYGQLMAVSTHFVSKDRLELLAALGIPVLVCTGTDDTLVNPSNSHYLASVLKARVFTVFEGCGHSPTSECHDVFILFIPILSMRFYVTHSKTGI
jgi:pimeloyl-ACP methyl ester carboxylesterase